MIPRLMTTPVSQLSKILQPDEYQELVRQTWRRIPRQHKIRLNCLYFRAWYFTWKSVKESLLKKAGHRRTLLISHTLVAQMVALWIFYEFRTFMTLTPDLARTMTAQDVWAMNKVLITGGRCITPRVAHRMAITAKAVDKLKQGL